MGVNWDLAKAQANVHKHGVYFADALVALEDPAAVSVRDDQDAEERWITICMDVFAQILVVVHTWRGSDVRIISARLATPREREQYLGNL
jgi:uncharacterized DUF497 family protein